MFKSFKSKFENSTHPAFIVDSSNLKIYWLNQPTVTYLNLYKDYFLNKNNLMDLNNDIFFIKEGEEIRGFYQTKLNRETTISCPIIIWSAIRENKLWLLFYVEKMFLIDSNSCTFLSEPVSISKKKKQKLLEEVEANQTAYILSMNEKGIMGVSSPKMQQDMIKYRVDSIIGRFEQSTALKIKSMTSGSTLLLNSLYWLGTRLIKAIFHCQCLEFDGEKIYIIEFLSPEVVLGEVEILNLLSSNSSQGLSG